MPLQNRVTALGDLVVATDSGPQRHHEAALDDLRDGAFVLSQGSPCRVLGAQRQSWTAGGYAARLPRRASRLARVITPPSLVGALHVPLVHPSALAGEA